jgi:alkanesulfonate monooxygenase SsuD/methylene tetrahydromethanopterin reductase-like flavin-dependent oxidoreductase (luciferase family)
MKRNLFFLFTFSAMEGNKMTIQFGLFLSNQHQPDEDPKIKLLETIEQVHRARQNGLQSIWVGQHFLTKPLQMFQCIPLLARLAPEAEGMMIGSNILILPLLNPVAVAEEIVTMDYITGGHFVLGVGIGYREEEFQVFNVDISKRTGRFKESIELIRRLWTEDTVTHTGTHFHIPGLGLGIKPLNVGGPPIWIGASVEQAIKRAAQIGDAWLITFYPSIGLLSDQILAYKTNLSEFEKPIPEVLPILRECYIGLDRKTAIQECLPSLEVKYAAYASWKQDRFLPESEKFNQPFDQFMNDRFIIGDPIFVRDEIQRYYDILGVNHFILRMQWPGLDQGKTLRAIDLLGEKVIPFVG